MSKTEWHLSNLEQVTRQPQRKGLMHIKIIILCFIDQLVNVYFALQITQAAIFRKLHGPFLLLALSFISFLFFSWAGGEAFRTSLTQSERPGEGDWGMHGFVLHCGCIGVGFFSFFCCCSVVLFCFCISFFFFCFLFFCCCCCFCFFFIFVWNRV